MLRLMWVFLALVAAVNLVGASPDPYLIVPGQGFGKFKASLGMAALEKLTAPGIFGQGVGSGQINMTDPVTRVDLVVGSKGTVKAMVIHGDESKWHTQEGLTLGTTLETLEKLNGQPFHFRSFEGQRAGEIVDWGRESWSSRWSASK